MTDPILRHIPPSFSSERLTIALVHPDQTEAVHEAIRESWDAIRQWLPWAAADKPQEFDTTEISMRKAFALAVERKDLRMHIFLKNSPICIGGTGLHCIDWRTPKFEIGYWLRTSYQGKGYMTEAVEALTQFAFDQLAAERVEIRCDVNNLASAAIPRRLGFQLEGTLRHDERHHLTGELRNTHIFAKIRAD